MSFLDCNALQLETATESMTMATSQQESQPFVIVGREELEIAQPDANEEIMAEVCVL